MALHQHPSAIDVICPAPVAIWISKLWSGGEEAVEWNVLPGDLCKAAVLSPFHT